MSELVEEFRGVGRFDVDDGGTRNIDGDWINNINGERQKPTHWMPLPASPRSRANE